jgi:hypothetical protein
MTLFATEGDRAMLVELSVMEQRYHAVVEVISPGLTKPQLNSVLNERRKWSRPQAGRS